MVSEAGVGVGGSIIYIERVSVSDRLRIDTGMLSRKGRERLRLLAERTAQASYMDLTKML